VVYAPPLLLLPPILFYTVQLFNKYQRAQDNSHKEHEEHIKSMGMYQPSAEHGEASRDYAPRTSSTLIYGSVLPGGCL